MHEGLCYSWSDLNIDNGFKISSIKPDLGAQPLSILSIVNLELIFPVGVVCRIWRDSLHCGRDSDPGSNGVSDPFDGTNGLPRLGDLSKYGYYIGSIRCDKA